MTIFLSLLVTFHCSWSTREVAADTMVGMDSMHGVVAAVRHLLVRVRPRSIDCTGDVAGVEDMQTDVQVQEVRSDLPIGALSLPLPKKMLMADA